MKWLICKFKGHKWGKWPGSAGQMGEGFVFTCDRCGAAGIA